ncbi:hypothetical protein BBJ28_00010487 [Nothophytophthora sp. Chile5]|nr:hypothetical protein BBJ28_00010487 [Nothophytophthora sp. Chile5]
MEATESAEPQEAKDPASSSGQDGVAAPAPALESDGRVAAEASPSPEKPQKPADPEPREGATSSATSSVDAPPVEEPAASPSVANVPATADPESADQGALDEGEGRSLESSGGVEQSTSNATSQASLQPVSTGFLDALTAEFSSDTKAAWAQLFGPRYDDLEDEDVASGSTDRQEAADDRVPSKSSVQTKLEQQQRLDEQIQASQRRYRERVLRAAAAVNTKPKTRQPSRRQAKAPAAALPTATPFEQAGLSLTQVRVCTERALDETCRAFRRLHALALEEADDPSLPVVHGAFATQWELEQLVRELFEPQDPALSTSGTGRKGSLVAPLGSAGRSEDEEISLTTQLQASWLLPFGCLPQLRSLVMKITRRHLSEDKLAVVNRQLQKQLTLLPLSSSLQQLLLQFSAHQQPDGGPDMRSQTKSPLRTSATLSSSFLEAIAVQTEAAVEDADVLLLPPMELLAKARLSSVLQAQRLVFFRFLVEILAVERARSRSKPVGAAPLPVTSNRVSGQQKPSRRRSSSKLRTSDAAAAPVGPPPVRRGQEDAGGGDEMASLRASTSTVHGSLPDPSEAEIDEELAVFEAPADAEEVGDRCARPAGLLQQQLEAAMTRLRHGLPSIEDDSTQAVDPAIRATFLAAVACQQSVHVLAQNSVEMDDAMAEKLRHFIQALDAVQVEQQRPLQAGEWGVDGPRFPPPYPESTAPEEDEDRPTFPPPYAVTTPSYWTFAPALPSPEPSLAKASSSKSPSGRFATRNASSPGVGAYDIQQGDRLTFQQRPSYSFGSAGGGSIGRERPSSVEASEPSSSSSNRLKPQPSPSTKPRGRLKTALAFVPALLRPVTAERLEDEPLEPLEGDARAAPAEEGAADERVESEMLEALRRQQRMVVDEFVQQVVGSNGHANAKREVARQTLRTPKTQHWPASQTSPGLERLLRRQRRAPARAEASAASTASRPAAIRPAKRSTKGMAAMDSPPPRRQLDNDQHLAWAARINELYQPQAASSAAPQPTGIT